MAFWNQQYLANEVWRWLALFGVVLASLVLGRVVAAVLAGQSNRLKAGGRMPLVQVLLNSIVGPAKLLVLAGGLYFAGTVIRFEIEGQAQILSTIAFWVNVCRALAVVAATWFLFRLVDLAEILLTRWAARAETPLDRQFVPLIRKTLRVFVVIVAGLFIAQNLFQWDIGALIAGLGIGGLALALAAQDMVSNVFGSVMIFGDRPFRLGERIKFQGHDGVVEQVGFRSTRIRTLVGHLVIVPNSLLAKEAVENVAQRPYIRRVLNVTIPYDTPPDKVRRAVAILSEMLEARQAHFRPDLPGRVYFDEFNAASLNLIVYYWFAPPDWWEYLAFTHEFNLELLDRFNREGIEFAFPTQTLYVKRGGAPAE